MTPTLDLEQSLQKHYGSRCFPCAEQHYRCDRESSYQSCKVAGIDCTCSPGAGREANAHRNRRKDNIDGMVPVEYLGLYEKTSPSTLTSSSSSSRRSARLKDRASSTPSTSMQLPQKRSSVEYEGSHGPPVKHVRQSAKISAPALPTPEQSAPVEVEVEDEAAGSNEPAKRTRRSMKVTPVSASSSEKHSTQVGVEDEVETRT